MTQSRTLDVSGLAPGAFGHRSILWWGTMGIMLIEGMAFAITIGAIVAVLRIAYAGYLYMGSDMWSSKGKAKEVLGEVTLGLLLLLGVYLILYQINPDIVTLKALDVIRSSPAPTAPPGTVLVTPDNPSTPDDTPCTLTDSNGKSYPGLFQGGTCRFAP